MNLIKATEIIVASGFNALKASVVIRTDCMDICYQDKLVGFNALKASVVIRTSDNNQQ